jgi:uncharacterized glyoxalase superfamily protein PhnB
MAATTSSKLVASAPAFVVKSVPDAIAYYCDRLGFEETFRYGDPVFYGGVCRGEVTIHFAAASSTKRQPGHNALNIFVTDVDAIYDELKGRGADLLNEVKDRPYGMRDFDIRDSDGNGLCFGMGTKKS